MMRAAASSPVAMRYDQVSGVFKNSAHLISRFVTGIAPVAIERVAYDAYHRARLVSKSVVPLVSDHDLRALWRIAARGLAPPDRLGSIALYSICCKCA
jgi:hypothetical protein